MRQYAIRVLLGAMLVLAGSNASAQTPAVTVSFGDSVYSANEGGSVAVQVQLDVDPERTVTIPLEATPGAGAETGDFTAPTQVVFVSGETSKSVTFEATEDTEDDDDETVELGFGALPDSVSEGSPGTAIVTIADNDEAVTASFASATYAVTEGWTVDVMVTLDVDPERTVTIPVQASRAASGQYSIPGTVTFYAGETRKPVNFATVDNTVVENAETFTLSFGSALPTDVSASGQTTVTITDDDAPDTDNLELSALAVTGGTGSMYPVFNPRTYHYAIRCPDATTLRVTATARDAAHQLTLNNIPVPDIDDENVVVDSDQDVAIELSDGGESVTYIVHCIPANFPNIKIVKKQAGVSDGLMFFTPARNPFPRTPAFLAIMDNNGVPRFVRPSPDETPLNFRRHVTDLKIDGRPVHYSVTHRPGSSFDGRHSLLDASFNVIRTVETTHADHTASLHDFLITEDDTFLFFSHGTVTRDVEGSEVETFENVLEEVSPTGEILWSWSSWDHLTIDPDCLGYTYGSAGITAHINALTLIDGDVVASSRGCAQVVRIKRSAKSETDDGTDLVWQLGGTDQDADDRAFLAISGDESGRNEFCRQHHATETASGTVVLFDNGVNCLSAEMGEPNGRERGDLPTFSRAVEYDIDPDTGTAEFHREVRLDRRYGYAPFTGSVDILENGHWLINWGYLREADSSLSVEEYSIAISEVDASGTELLQVKTWEGTSRYSTFRVYRESEADVEIPLNLPVTLTLEDERAAESAGEMVFAVRLSVASSEAVAVDYETANGTATAGQDYEAQSGTLTFPANSTTPQEIRVPILDDTVDEAEEETLTVRLRNATNATLAGGETSLAATGTIIDDDTAPPPPPPPPPPPGGGGEDRRDLHGNTPAQATRVRLSSSAPWASSTDGQINPASDVDYFTLMVPQAGVLVVQTTGSTATVGTAWQAGVELGSADRGGVRQNFRLSVPVAAGPVVIAVAGQGSRTGSYTVETRLMVGYLENPGNTSFQSGIGVLSGWVCAAEEVEITLGALTPQMAAYGTERLDTASKCGDTDNGFGLLFNWNLLGDGEHDVVALVDGVELDRASVTVTTLGQEFLRGVEGTCTVSDFPSLGKTVTLLWQEARQNFAIADGAVPSGETRSGAADVGYLENPSPNSFQSGVGVLSGWVCEAETVEITLGPLAPQVAGYGTERLDTQEVCGDTDNGFGLLFNWNLLGDGEHTVVAYVDATELGRATVQVTTLGQEFLRGAEGECVVDDFPRLGQSVLLEWQQNSQNFVITDLE